MFWQFRFTAHTDMKLAALARHLRSQPDVKKVYLINQDYTYGRSISVSGRKYLEAAGIAIVGDDLHPVGKVRDFSSYVTKIRQSGAQAILTGNWGDDMTLFAKAIADAGLKIDMYTFAGNTAGVVTAIGKAGLGVLKVIDDWDGNMVDPYLDQLLSEFKAKTGYDFAYLRGIVMMDMLSQAIARAGTTNPRAIAAALSGARYTNLTGEWVIRPEDHQISMPIHIATLSDKVKFGLEKTGMGYRVDAKVERAEVLTPVKCRVKVP
jgi:branched-chain amino acid transport system substrate-binding protein